MLELHTWWINVLPVMALISFLSPPLSVPLLNWFTHEGLDPCCYCLLIIRYLLNHQIILPRRSQSSKQQGHLEPFYLEPSFVPHCLLRQRGVSARPQSFWGSSDVLWSLLRLIRWIRKVLYGSCETWWERSAGQIEQFGQHVSVIHDVYF